MDNRDKGGTMNQEATRQAMLDYRAARWQGGDGRQIVWMKDATFQHYVTAYLAAQSIGNPTAQQRYAAIQTCRQLSFWRGVQDIGNVHIRQRLSGGEGGAGEEVDQ